MLPRSSMQTSRLTSTRSRASRRAPVARLTVTIAGSSCGVMPTAIASENSSRLSRSGRPSATLITKIETVSTAGDVDEQHRERRSPSWNAVCPCRSPSRTAIAPNAVCAPVRDDDGPRPSPPRTTVPMNAHDGRSSGESPGGRGVGRLGRRARLAGQHGLVAFELVRREQPQVGGHDVADTQVHDVARNELASRRPRPGRRRARRTRGGGSGSAAPRPPSPPGTR